MPTSITTAPILDEFTAHKFSFTDGGHENVCGPGDFGQISTARVRNRDSGVTASPLLHQEKAKGFAHQHTAPDDHYMRSGGFDAALQEKTLAT